MDSHEHACQHHHSEAAAAPATCGGSGPCGVDGQACAGCGDSALAMPVTEETVTLRANDLATLLDLVEAFAGSSHDEDGAFTRANEAFEAQAPELVAARETLLATIREMANRVSETRQN